MKIKVMAIKSIANVYCLTTNYILVIIFLYLLCTTIQQAGFRDKPHDIYIVWSTNKT